MVSDFLDAQCMPASTGLKGHSSYRKESVWAATKCPSTRETRSMTGLDLGSLNQKEHLLHILSGHEIQLTVELYWSELCGSTDFQIFFFFFNKYRATQSVVA